MKDELIFLEKADRYIEGSLSEAEHADFEKECAENQTARQLFEEHKYIRQQLEQQNHRKEIKQSIEHTYQKWHAHDRKQLPSRSAKISFLWKAIAVAATLALIISIGGYWLTMNRLNQHKTKSYTILRREIDNIKRSQKDLIDDIHSSKQGASVSQYGGTGFALSTNGYIATNAHVVRGADSIYVITHDQKSFKAILAYEDTKCDLAILKIVDSTFNIPTLPFSLSSNSAPLGEEIYTLGYPRDEVVYGKGYISSETGFRGDSASYQLTLPVNPGNSGGPLIDENGKILGIISGKQSTTDNIAFAVKSSYLLKMLDSIPDGFPQQPLINSHSHLKSLSRINQLKRLEQYVFLVKVYN